MPEEQPFTVGVVVSPHPHGRFHLETLEVLPEVAVVYLCALDGEDGSALADGLTKVQRTTSDLEALLAAPEVDALLVCVRNDRCPAILEAAVAAGKAALFEKPGARRSADLRRVAAAARLAGVTLGGLLQWRAHPILQEVREARRAGALGAVMAVEGRMVTSQVRYRDPAHWLFRQEAAGSGILSWLAIHYLDALCFLLDDRISEVAAIVAQRNPEPIDVEDSAALALRFAGGAIGSFHAGYHLIGGKPGYGGAAYDTFLALRGSHGYARLPLSEGSVYTLESDAPGWAAAGKRECRYQFPTSRAYGGLSGAQFVLQFLRAARSGSPPLCPIEAVVHLLDVVEAALESSASGRRVAVHSGEP